MAGEEREDVVEQEKDARRARTESEAERAAAEREAETGHGERGGVLPEDSDEERRGVMPPPEGTGRG